MHEGKIRLQQAVVYNGSALGDIRGELAEVLDAMQANRGPDEGASVERHGGPFAGNLDPRVMIPQIIRW